MANGIENSSRNRRLRPLSDDLPVPTRVLLRELRALKERAGFDLRALEQATHASRSSWGRWLAGETWIPLDAVEGLARLCRADENRFREMWEAAEQARRSAGATDGDASHQEAPLQQHPGLAPPAVRAPGPGTPPPPASGPAPHGQAAPHEQAPREPATSDERAAPRGPADRLRRRFLVGAAVGLVIGAVAGAVLTGSAVRGGTGGEAAPAATGSPAGRGTPRAAPVTGRAEVTGRAGGWRPATARRVPYSQFKTYGGYRTDGSGYASMALGLPRPGPNTISLASSAYSRPIKMAELLQGDLVIDPVGGNTARAVVIFDKWANAAHTSYWAYQQRAGYGTDHRVVDHGLTSGTQFRAYRPVNIRDAAGG
ncbi:helix-turn-helix domain-containing protein [Sphaerisporangium dianthi]|uniref:Helix-turn-helix domain-containing protein n=1 Tax=Sphaerisporangium dianthi TaxID=1436120 RepID=A0ABV9CCW2_9ACTN